MSGSKLSHPITLSVLTVSDGVVAGTRDDASGRAITEWAAARGMQVHTHAQTPDRTDTIADVAFLAALAEALVLSGLAMATAGSSRPCSGGDHEILHAIDHLYPGTARHGELAGAATLFTSYLRGDEGMALPEP